MLRNPIKRLGERFYSPVGSKHKSDYQLKVEPDGNKKLVAVGSTDVYAKIQSHEQECSIDYILKRYAAGDTSVLSRAQGIYCDTTILPQDLITATEAVRKAESFYNSLSADARSKYGGFDAFIKSIGTIQGLNDFVQSLQPVELDPVEEVKQNEQTAE